MVCKPYLFIIYIYYIFIIARINPCLGIMLHGHALKVRRPKDYIPAPAIDLAGGTPSLPAGAIVATNVPDSPYKVSAFNQEGKNEAFDCNRYSLVVYQPTWKKDKSRTYYRLLDP